LKTRKKEKQKLAESLEISKLGKGLFKSIAETRKRGSSNLTSIAQI